MGLNSLKIYFQLFFCFDEMNSGKEIVQFCDLNFKKPLNFYFFKSFVLFSIQQQVF